jgi:hypothetical protein
MNEIETIIKDKEDRFALPLIAKLLVAILIYIFIKHYFDFDGKYYNGEPLVTKVVNEVNLGQIGILLSRQTIIADSG